VILSPVNFEALYYQGKQQAEQNSATAEKAEETQKIMQQQAEQSSVAAEELEKPEETRKITH
jgi:preprotein translocase subunit SecB